VEPLASAVPFMVKVAVGSLVMGFIVIAAIALPTLSVYAVVPVVKTGLNFPLPGTRNDKPAFVEGTRITVIV
jgi:hypothetical protein